MIRIPAFCRSCGAIFISSQIQMQSVTSLRITDSTDTCPRCGGVADLLEGTFDAVGGTLRLLSGPQISRERLWRLRQLLEQQRAAGVPAEEIEARVRREIPESKSIFDQWTEMPSLAKIGFITGILSFILAFGPWSEDFGAATKWIVEHVATEER